MEKNEFLIKMVLRHEGGWANVCSDNGGETYCGVAKRSHPKWEGWGILKQYEPLKHNQLVNDSALEKCVIDVYMCDYYIPMKVSMIDNMMLSAHLFCHGVNAGSCAAIKLLQKSINKVYNANICVDGKIGKHTLSYANNINLILELIECFIENRNEFYNNIVKRNPKQKKFLKGWLSRVNGTTQTINSYYKTVSNPTKQNVLYADGNYKVNILQKIFNFIISLIAKK